MESQKYVKAAIDTIKALLLEDDRELNSGQGGRHHGPLPPTYHPESDETPMCDKEMASRFQEIVGIF
jgi:hypothetical protein